MTKGYTTSEFWVTCVLSLAGLLLASGLVPETHWLAQALGAVLALAAKLGYDWARVRVKSAAALERVAGLSALPPSPSTGLTRVQSGDELS